MNVKIIGLGGIGSYLCDVLSRYVNHDQSRKYLITLIDGDQYETKNFTRQSFQNLGNKASVKATEMGLRFDNVAFESIPEYVNTSNLPDCITEGDVVFLCVDNHATRKLVSDYCGKLKDIILISGGNEYTDGNVQIFIRQNDEDITASLTDYHPEIQTPTDKNPDDMSCEELSQTSDPQLLFTNLTAATIMLWVFYRISQENSCEYGEIYFDMDEMALLAKIRKPIEERKIKHV